MKTIKQVLTDNYGFTGEVVTRQRQEAKKSKTIYLAINNDLAAMPLSETEANIFAKAYYDLAVRVNASNFTEFEAGMEREQSSARINYSADWIKAIKDSPESVWSFPPIANADKLSKSHMVEAVNIFMTQMRLGFTSHSEDETKALLENLGVLQSAIAEDRNRKGKG